MTAQPLVSIIINNFNYERYLKQAIDSALDQTYSNVEIIVVDDGSTDKSPGIIKSYGDKVIPLLKNNGGQASAFNAGFYACKGELICFLDADDMLLPEAIENAVSIFNGTGTVKIHWSMFIIDDNDRQNGDVIPKGDLLEGDRREIVLTKGPFHDWHLNPPTSGNLWARWFLDKTLPVPEDQFPLGADGYLHTLAPLYGSVRSVKNPQGFYRMHSNNNYFRRKLDEETVRFYQKRFENYFAAYRSHLAMQGIQVDNHSWKKENFNYLWLQRLVEARKAVEKQIPSGSSCIFIDNNELGDQFMSSLKIIPFLEKDGEYAGAPENDACAIAEIEKHKAAGVRYLIFWWTAFWWLEHYSTFAHYLDTNYKRIISEEHLIAFCLAE